MVVYMSGNAADDVLGDQAVFSATTFIRKPFRGDELVKILSRAII